MQFRSPSPAMASLLSSHVIFRNFLMTFFAFPHFLSIFSKIGAAQERMYFVSHISFLKILIKIHLKWPKSFSPVWNKSIRNYCIKVMYNLIIGKRASLRDSFNHNDVFHKLGRHHFKCSCRIWLRPIKVRKTFFDFLQQAIFEREWQVLRFFSKKIIWKISVT